MLHFAASGPALDCQQNQRKSLSPGVEHWGSSSSSSSSIPQPWQSLGNHGWFHNQFPLFSILHCALGLGELQACPFPDVVFPPLPVSAFFPLSLCLARWFWLDLTNGRHVPTTAVCVSLRWSGVLRVVRLPAGSWHGQRGKDPPPPPTLQTQHTQNAHCNVNTRQLSSHLVR